MCGKTAESRLKCAMKIGSLPRKSQSLGVEESVVYRWRYTLNLYRNLGALKKHIKVFNWIALCFMLIVLIVDDFRFTVSDVKCFFGAYVFYVVFLFLSYYIYAFLQGGRTSWEYVVDSKGVTSSLVESNLMRTKFVEGMLQFMAAFGHILSLGRRLSQRKSIYSEFGSVTKIKADRDNNVIKIYFGRIFSKSGRICNKILVPEEYYDTVLCFIISHCRVKNLASDGVFGSNVESRASRFSVLRAIRASTCRTACGRGG